MDYNGSTDFTNKAWDAMYDVVDNSYFLDKDSELIYSALEKKLRLISFGDYLKRYIYRKAALKEPFETVPLVTYQQIIRDAFADNNTPQAFEYTTAKLSALSKNWLMQQTVKRKVVFLLGFGLSMSVDDVNTFLTKALREQGINAKDPFEVICWYCYKNGYSYPKYEKMWQIFCDTSPNSVDVKLLYSDYTIGARDVVNSINSDTALIAFVSKLKTPENSIHLSVTAKKCFDKLYDRARELVASLYNREEEYLFKVTDRRVRQKTYEYTDITESDLEHIISSAIPIDRHGNLTPSKSSKLNEQFLGKRFNRQHICDILSKKTEVTRFDLITLNFFIFSQMVDEYPNAKVRYASYIESTNAVLNECFLGEILINNPYECFVLMCILSEDPLGTYADVWEMSYGE